MRFSPDSRRLAVPSRGKSTVDIYETSDWKKVAELEHDSARATAWSADGRWLVTSTGSSMRLWDAEALERRAELEEGRIWSLSFDHRRPRLVGGIDGGYALWEIDQKEGGVVAFGPKQSRVVQSEGKSRIQGLRHEVAMSPDTAELATPSGIYALDSRQERSRMPPGIISLAFLPRGRKLVAGYPDGNVAVSTYDAQEMRRLDHERPVNSMAISPDTKWLATADEDGTARVFDMRTGLEERPIEQEVKVNSISFSPRGRWLVTIAGTTVRVFAVDGWRRVALIDHETTVQGLDFIRDDMRLVTRAGKVVQVVSLDTDVKSTPLLHSHAVRNAYVSGDGAWLQTVTVTGTVTSPVTRRGRRRGETTKTTETTAAFLWDANGNLVAWPSNAKEDSPIGDSQDLLRPGRDDRWIEITARRELRPGLQNPPWAVATTTRGKKLLSVYLERTSEAHHGQRTGYSISPDGQWLVTTGSDATVRLWPLEAEELVKLVCSRLPRNLTPQEWSQLQVDDGPQRKTCDSLP
jgi:WD40 repeat protein